MQSGLSPSPYTNRKSKSKRRKGEKEKNPLTLTLALVFLSVDIFTFVKYVHESEFDMFSLRCEPQKLILRFGEPQALELDILPLRANSI